MTSILVMLAIVLKTEKQFRLKHKEIVQIHTFLYLCYIITASSINLNNHLKKTRRIDISLRSKDTMMTSHEKRILIVDDEPDIANLYKLSLECDGFVVDTFNDPLLVLSNYRAGIYDLLLIDIKMPQMNGFELYQKLRNVGDNPKVCFITAFEEFNKQFRELFPNLKEKVSFLRKPIELDYLSSVIKSELGYN